MDEGQSGDGGDVARERSWLRPSAAWPPRVAATPSRVEGVVVDRRAGVMRVRPPAIEIELDRLVHAGGAIRLLRGALGIGGDEVAGRIGIDDSLLYRIERGDRRLTVGRLLSACTACGARAKLVLELDPLGVGWGAFLGDDEV